MERFIGREQDLKLLQQFLHKKSSSLLVLKGRRRIGKTTLITQFAKPYIFYSLTKQPGCQIDYMIQTRHQSLYICEVKFSQKLIGSEVIPQIQEKINRLKRPKGFSCRPVLIHVNGVSQDIIESDFFSHIIDFSQALL